MTLIARHSATKLYAVTVERLDTEDEYVVRVRSNATALWSKGSIITEHYADTEKEARMLANIAWKILRKGHEPTWNGRSIFYPLP